MIFKAVPVRMLAALSLLVSTPALAELPQPVRDMVEAAIATGDAAKVTTVAEIARQTNPDDIAEIDAMLQGFEQAQQALAAERAREEERAIRSAGLFDNWSGSGEIGAFHSSGNSGEAGLSLGLKLKREGIDWSHAFRVTADYKHSNGTTTREQIFAAYEPRYQIDDGLFAYGLGQFERDRFQGFSARYALSGGLGYKLVDNDRLQLSAKLGPAFRTTTFTDGTSESRLAGLAGLDFDWQISDRLKLTQDTNMVADAGGEATVIFDSANTSLVVVTGLEAKISDKLSTRLSFKLDYDSNPPAGAVSTDTLSRFTLLYGF